MPVGLNRRTLALAALGGALIGTLVAAAGRGQHHLHGDLGGRHRRQYLWVRVHAPSGDQRRQRNRRPGLDPLRARRLVRDRPGRGAAGRQDPAGLTVAGAGATDVTINGGDSVRVISVDQGAELTVADLTIENGSAGANNGGAIFNQAGTLTVREATLSGNTTGASGGALYNNGGAVTVTGSTFSANTAASGAGGGILNTADGALDVTNSTFAGNAAGSGGAWGVGYRPFQNRANQGGAANVSAGTAAVRATILAGSPRGQGGSCSGTIADGGYDIDDGTTCGFSSANHSLSGANPRLDSHGLQSNGGPTQTVAVLAASPAVDAIPAGAIGCGTDITTDQRGQHRPQGPRCDSGAFELAQTPGQIVVDTAADGQQPTACARCGRRS